MSSYPAGWYDDPDRFGAERYWDGEAWTDEQRFVTRLDEILRLSRYDKDDRRLVVSGEHVSWGDDSIRWDEVTGFDVVTRLDVNRKPALYVVTINRDRDDFTFNFTAGHDDRMASAVDTIIDQAQRVFLPRLANELLRRVDAGEAVESREWRCPLVVSARPRSRTIPCRGLSMAGGGCRGLISTWTG